MPAPMVGLIGDAFTLFGGLLLAWDAIQKEAEVDKIKKIASRLADPRLAKLKFVEEGVEISSEATVEKAFIRRSARKAKWGCIVLAVGFSFLLIARLAEIL